MRTALVYTSARFVLFLVALVVLYFAGARGLLLAALALLVSGIASFVLLSRQRDVMSGALSSRLRGVRNRAGELRTRLNEGSRAEDRD
jgi:TctA family transporter